MIPNTENIELICVKINSGYTNKHVYVLCCYIRPNSQPDTYQLLVDAVDFLFDCTNSIDDLFVVGDFNLPNLIWSQSVDNTHFVAANARSSSEVLVTDNFSNSGLMQLSNVKNNLNRQLDLVFSSRAENCKVSNSNLALCSIDLYHPPLLISFSSVQDRCNFNYETSTCFNFRKTDFLKLNDLLANTDFNTILGDNHNLETQTQNFYVAMSECFHASVPLTTRRCKQGVPPWYTKELRSLRNLRNKLWKKFVRRRTDSDHQNYVNIYNEFSNLSRVLYNEYLVSMQSQIITDPKRFWQFINYKRKSDGYPSMLKFNDHTSGDPKTIANLFAEFFNSAYSNSDIDPDANYFSYMSNCTLASSASIQIDLDSVIRSINNLKDDFSVGPDGLPPIVLKRCIAYLAQPLTTLFQNSIKLGIFPSIWKDSFIVPFHKKGCKSDVSNYRPIAKLSCIPKLFESIVYDSLYFQCKTLFSPNQHGFLRGRSTTTNLLEFTSHTLQVMEGGSEIDVIATDFSKAFDRVSHNIILFKLRALGFAPQLLLWVDSYLRDRRCQVIFRSSLSAPFTAPSGVPQGSHLGPIFFILSINDVDFAIKNSSISIYADDMKIYRQISSPTDVELLQSDLNNFITWCTKSGLDLNVSKCQSITYSRKRANSFSREYTINSAVVSRVLTIRDLGVICDRKLTFRDHIDFVVSRANSVLGFVKRWSKEFLNPYVTRAIYMTFVRPLLEYASQVWSPYHEVHIRRIEAVQRKFLRFALRDFSWVDIYNLPPYLDRLKIIKLKPLTKRRSVADIVFIHQLLSGGVDSSALLGKIHLNVNARALRMVPAFRIAPHRTAYGQNEPVTRMLRETNNYFEFFDYHISKFALKKLLFSS